MWLISGAIKYGIVKPVQGARRLTKKAGQGIGYVWGKAIGYEKGKGFNRKENGLPGVIYKTASGARNILTNGVKGGSERVKSKLPKKSADTIKTSSTAVADNLAGVDDSAKKTYETAKVPLTVDTDGDGIPDAPKKEWVIRRMARNTKDILTMKGWREWLADIHQRVDGFGKRVFMKVFDTPFAKAA